MADVANFEDGGKGTRLSIDKGFLELEKQRKQTDSEGSTDQQSSWFHLSENRFKLVTSRTGNNKFMFCKLRNFSNYNSSTKKLIQLLNNFKIQATPSSLKYFSFLLPSLFLLSLSPFLPLPWNDRLPSLLFTRTWQFYPTYAKHIHTKPHRWNEE